MVKYEGKLFMTTPPPTVEPEVWTVSVSRFPQPSPAVGAAAAAAAAALAAQVHKRRNFRCVGMLDGLKRRSLQLAKRRKGAGAGGSVTSRLERGKWLVNTRVRHALHHALGLTTPLCARRSRLWQAAYPTRWTSSFLKR